MEFTDRYQALGIPYPDPKTMCEEECEGTGWIPVFMSVNLPPAKEGEIRLGTEEENEMLRALWLEAEAKSPADDGWHFVKCPACGGTGKKP